MKENVDETKKDILNYKKFKKLMVNELGYYPAPNFMLSELNYTPVKVKPHDLKKLKLSREFLFFPIIKTKLFVSPV